MGENYLDRRFLFGIVDLANSITAALYSSKSLDAFARCSAGS
jgi:hypothetical protein